MNIILALSTVTLALQAAAALAAFVIARAPGWRRVRIVAWLAATAGLYSLFDLVGALYASTPEALGRVTSANLTVAAVHVAIWTWFSYADAEGRWNSLPIWLRILVPVQLAWTATLALLGGAVDPERLDYVVLESLGVRFAQPALTPLASLSAGISLALLLLSFAEQVRQARRGVRGAAAIAAGFAVFIACGLEELAVAAGLIDFIFLAELGYLAIVIPVIAQLLRRFTEDARRLHALTASLGDEVARKTAERDSAREALAAQARFTALGRMAGGVGHEINNPLQVLTMRLEELHEALPPGPSEDREAVENCIAATQRIERIVEGMRAYTLPAGAAPARVSPVELVRDAIEQMRPQLAAIEQLETRLDPVPDVIVDRERVTGAIVQLIANAVIAVGEAPRAPRRIVISTAAGEPGEAVVEVRDSGSGFPAELLARLGEPFLTTRPTQRSAGLGLFIVRGVAAAHGGALELENAPDGGAVVRLRLR